SCSSRSSCGTAETGPPSEASWTSCGLGPADAARPASPARRLASGLARPAQRAEEVAAMSIGEMQACLARLYVNEPFRRWFCLDPAAALEGYRLTEEERASL